ncbi:2-octaprenyl-6-methoxyphenol hydroxylase [BD1-7 clade bacterium]|uniref:2-octaprenyl-6-methoxyphenol hydroxylase n=1 Tax=BD1-7 clade bacterium TaxID=2029982 RepID=A0A5S9N419_9GAMM|nr:2-octaprenyl-6-methoxyphenol hydroxylase [BD1-7 clade bacterium]CAA0084512.1 2-octaprenyl-6-methoxyphenol hydroxylase [BD1-7 clade bacterium]
MSELQHVDIAIIGGGMVGASLAALLPASLSVALLESFPMPAMDAKIPQYQPSYDARSTALSHSSYTIFEQAGIWPLLRQHVEPIQQVHVSDKGNWGSTVMDHQSEGLEALGFVVENAWLGRSLLHFLQHNTAVNFLCPATVHQVRPQSDGAEIEYRLGRDDTTPVQKLTAKLVVVADGARSQICSSLGIHTNVTDYQHTAIVTNVSTSEPHQGTAYERFTANGPLALLPLTAQDGENRSALIWTMPSDIAEPLIDADDSAFLAALQDTFGRRMGEFQRVGQRHAYPLMLTTVDEQVRRHLVVLGNAAHSLHPVAGQGFNLALRDVQVLANLIADGQKTGRSSGELTLLEEYQRQQLLDQKTTALFSDVLPGLFARRQLPLVVGRGMGLLALELVPSLKSSFVRFATGMRQHSGGGY